MPPTPHLATVLRTTPLTARMVRVTLGGEGLEGFASSGVPDEHVKVFIPSAGERAPAMPSIGPGGWVYPEGAPRPHARSYTVRRFDAGRGQVDIDFVLHGDGPAARWAAGARKGDVVGLMGPHGTWDPPAEVGRAVLLGDMTALPAVAAIVESLDVAQAATALIEVDGPHDRIAIAHGPRVEVRWLERGDTPAGRSLLPGALVTLNPPGEGDYVWAAGESGAMREVRRHLRDTLGLPRSAFRVTGYWKYRRSEDEAVEEHIAAIAAAREAGLGEAEIEDVAVF